MSSHSGPDPGATRSTRYFPVSAFPTFETTDLALSFTALSSHPRYREALKPFDQGHLDRYKKSAELLQRWESIAERYTAIDPEEDTEIDVVTGDTLYKGEKIDLDDDETLEQWADDPLDDEDEEDEMVDDSRICQAGDSVLDKLKGSAFQDSEGDRDVLDFWGAESEMQIQVGELPDISCLPVKDVSAKDQADLDAFLRDEEERKRQEELDSDGLGPGAYSDDHVENAIDDDSEDVIVCSIPIGRSARPSIVVSHPDESPRKKRRVGRPRKIRAAQDEICSQEMDHTASLDIINVAPSSDDVNLCSEVLGAGSEPFLTPKRPRGSGTRARRGRRSNIAPLTPHLVGVAPRETKAEALTSEWMDRNLLRSEITTPYISRSSRVVKVPERLGEHVEWARIRRPYGKRSSPPIRKANLVHMECYVDLPPLPADWFEDNAIPIATEKEVTTEDAAMAISSPQSVARETELEIPPMEREHQVDVAEDDTELESSSISEDSEVLLPESVIDVVQSPLIYESALVETVFGGSAAEHPDILERSDADILNAAHEREFLESLLAMGTTYTSEREASVELEALRFPMSPSPSVLASSSQAEDEPRMDPSSSSPSARTTLYNADASSALEQSWQPDSVLEEPGPEFALFEVGPSLPSPSEACAVETLPTIWIDMSEPVPSGRGSTPSGTEPEQCKTELRQTLDQPPSPRVIDYKERSEPRDVDLILVKDEPLDDDDPLAWNTLDDSLDELNVELNLNRRVMLPISVRLPKGSKGSAFENPICVDDDEDELGGWDLDGWS
jgi:hypothetical protein